ncbi:hypothetical protein PM04_02630 [Thalassobacter sp. 16PALIMAR09]|nr:hypothetical protein PM04_02630 [Thalassobacter sp. 16PALIMAR09]
MGWSTFTPAPANSPKRSRLCSICPAPSGTPCPASVARPAVSLPRTGSSNHVRFRSPAPRKNANAASTSIRQLASAINSARGPMASRTALSRARS